MLWSMMVLVNDGGGAIVSSKLKENNRPDWVPFSGNLGRWTSIYWN